MRSVLVVQHAEIEGPGLLARAFLDNGLRPRVVRTDRGETVPRRAAGDAAIVLLGGPMAVYEAERYPHLRDEIALAADALERDLPILALCLGSQILAAAAGSRVYRGAQPEIGWFPVTLSAAGRADPVLGVLAPESTVFHWHADTFDLPEGAALLASSRLYPRQAFRLGRAAYGVQFHPEITPAMVDRWSAAATRTESTAFGGAAGAARLAYDSRRYAPPLETRFAALARAFFLNASGPS